MLFSDLCPVQQLRRLAGGVEELLAHTLGSTATPILRAVVRADGQAPNATGDTQRTTAVTAQNPDNPRPPRLVTARPSDIDAAEIRAWARSRGLQVADRGRISRTVIDQYLLAHAA